MLELDDQDSTVSRITRATEELSILAHELAAATSAVADQVSGYPRPARDSAAAIATSLQATSHRMRSQILSLIEIAYAQNEESIAQSRDPRAERCAAALGRITRILEPVFELGQELAGRLRALHTVVQAQGRSLTSGDLQVLDRPICDLLADAPMATGAGVAVAPGLLADCHLWMQWWISTRARPAQLHFQFEPGHPRYYDYRKAVWYREAAQDRVSHLAPPHFDEGGTDRYMITAAVPALIEELFLGLGCGEVTLEHLDGLVRPALQALQVPAALITPDGLVAASTDEELAPAAHVPAPLAARIAGSRPAAFVELSPDQTIARSNALSWDLLARWR